MDSIKKSKLIVSINSVAHYFYKNDDVEYGKTIFLRDKFTKDIISARETVIILSLKLSLNHNTHYNYQSFHPELELEFSFYSLYNVYTHSSIYENAKLLQYPGTYDFRYTVFEPHVRLKYIRLK